MKIAVIGSGAIGALLGSFLHQSGEDVIFVDIWEEHVMTILSEGLMVIRESGNEVFKVKATTKIEDVGTPDLIICAVKSYDNEQAAKDCQKIVGPATLILTVQNGVGNIESLGSILGFNRIIAGTCAFGSTVVGPGKIKSSPTGSLSIGELEGLNTPRLRQVVDTFTKAGIEIHTSENVNNLIWTKLIVNVGINAIASLTLLTNGQLLDYEETENILTAAVKEGEAVAKANGIHFEDEDILEHVKDICRSTSGNKASMRQDIERGAKTEINSINGAIVAEGQKLGIPTPINDTLTKLVRTIEKRGKILA